MGTLFSVPRRHLYGDPLVWLVGCTDEGPVQLEQVRGHFPLAAADRLGPGPWADVVTHAGSLAKGSQNGSIQSKHASGTAGIRVVRAQILQRFHWQCHSAGRFQRDE